jgi:hypothetical protein
MRKFLGKFEIHPIGLLAPIALIVIVIVAAIEPTSTTRECVLPRQEDNQETIRQAMATLQAMAMPAAAIEETSMAQECVLPRQEGNQETIRQVLAELSAQGFKLRP